MYPVSLGDKCFFFFVVFFFGGGGYYQVFRGQRTVSLLMAVRNTHMWAGVQWNEILHSQKKKRYKEVEPSWPPSFAVDNYKSASYQSGMLHRNITLTIHIRMQLFRNRFCIRSVHLNLNKHFLYACRKSWHIHEIMSSQYYTHTQNKGSQFSSM